MGSISSSSSLELPPQHQVFISFHGSELRMNFVAHLVRALKRNQISVSIATDECSGQSLETIALVILSSKYTESTWCLRELAKIVDYMDRGKLVAIPIFYKLDVSTVRGLRGEFGDRFRNLSVGNATKKMWGKALKSICDRQGITVDNISDEGKIIENIVEIVKERLYELKLEPSQKAKSTFGIKQRLNKMKVKLNLNKIRRQLGMIIGCLSLLFFLLQQFAYVSTHLIGAWPGVINVPKVLECTDCSDEEEDEHPWDTDTELYTGEYGAKPERSFFKAETNVDFHDRTFTHSRMEGRVKPPQIQVFINFRGELRNNFVGYLVNALQRSEINVFIDDQEQRGKDLNTLFKTIEDSGIAIVVFSSRYTESKWCLEELVKINERVNQSLLEVLPIFFKVTPTNVKRLKGVFGDHFRDKEHRYEYDEPMIKRWKKAIYDVSHKFALTFDENSSVLEIYFIDTIVKEVLKMLQAISNVEKDQSSG